MRFISFITSDISKTDLKLLLSPGKCPWIQIPILALYPPEHVQGLCVCGKRLVSGLPSSSERPTKAALLLEQLYPSVYKRERGSLRTVQRENKYHMDVTQREALVLAWLNKSVQYLLSPGHRMCGPGQTKKSKMRAHHCPSGRRNQKKIITCRLVSKNSKEIYTKFNRNQEEMRRDCQMLFILGSACRLVCPQNLYRNCLQGDNCTYSMLKEGEQEEQGRTDQSTYIVGSVL